MMKTALLNVLALASLVAAIAEHASPVIALARADTPSSNAILSEYPDWVLGLLCDSNAYSNQNPSPGKTLRFQTPVAINLNHVPQAREATRNIEAMTSGAVTFQIVDADPSGGIVVVAGDALTRDGEPGLGHVTRAREPQSVFAVTARDGVIQSRLYVHLGSASRDYAREGFRPSSIPEHELAHALGLMGHFPGFTGIEGVSLESLVTLTALYRVPPGTDVSRFCAPR
jgi:hypothetical protein